MKILVIHGPNLNRLGQRDEDIYGDVALDDINARLTDRASRLNKDIVLDFFQSNSEGTIIDYIQSAAADGIIINPAALTHYGLSLRDGLDDKKLPVIEVHLSNIHAREEWRHDSVIAPVAIGQISGFGYRSYIAALELMYDILNEETN